MKKLLTLLSLAMLLMSCGKGGSEAGEDDKLYSQYLKGNCGLDVVSDYNSAVGKCSYGNTVTVCVSYLEEFKAKYPGISCSANRGYGLDEEIVLITEDYIDGLIDLVQ